MSVRKLKHDFLVWWDLNGLSLVYALVGAIIMLFAVDQLMFPTARTLESSYLPEVRSLLLWLIASGAVAVSVAQSYFEMRFHNRRCLAWVLLLLTIQVIATCLLMLVGMKMYEIFGIGVESQAIVYVFMVILVPIVRAFPVWVLYSLRPKGYAQHKRVVQPRVVLSRVVNAKATWIVLRTLCTIGIVASFVG